MHHRDAADQPVTGNEQIIDAPTRETARQDPFHNLSCRLVRHQVLYNIIAGHIFVISLVKHILNHLILNRIMPFLDVFCFLPQGISRILIICLPILRQVIHPVKKVPGFLIPNPFSVLPVRRIQNIGQRVYRPISIINKMPVKNQIIAFHRQQAQDKHTGHRPGRRRYTQQSAAQGLPWQSCPLAVSFLRLSEHYFCPQHH